MNNSIISSLAFIPGRPDNGSELLSRYLPPIPPGITSTWLKNNIEPGSWILDPFAALPRLPIEIARAGYRIFVTANNPISRFLIEIAANPPTTDELRSALAVLAASYKADERIEPHIRSLYETHCARCGQLISADAFLWEQGNLIPTSKIYTCPYCGDTGEHICTPFDAERVRQFSTSGIHKARALERVIASTDQDRIHVEQALSVYLPRSLYALITIVNKLEGLNLSPGEKKCITILLLYAFDQTNVMWRIPATSERRRQLAIPRHFRENNTWIALEQGIDLFANRISNNGTSLSIPITYWPNIPPESGGICIYEGRLSTIADSLTKYNIKSICTAIPRPNQAFWTLSALWAGWLWGREALNSFKSVLHRQRYDWSWHTSALASVFKQLGSILEPGTKIFGLIGESEPGFIASSLISADYSGCQLNGIAIRNEDDQAQIIWNSTKSEISGDINNIQSEPGARAAKMFLEFNGEPASYLLTFTSALVSINQSLQIEDNKLLIKNLEPISNPRITQPDDMSQLEVSPSMTYSRLFNLAKEALSYRSGFLRFNLQSVSSAELTERIEISQTTLFAQDVGKIENGDDDSVDYDPTVDEAETISQKDRASRSFEYSESMMMWLRDVDNVNHKSISDRYELAILNLLLSQTSSSLEIIDQTLCDQFRGLFTPDREFINLCIDSYGEEVEPGSNSWHLRAEDQTGDRLIDIENIHTYVNQIGNQLGVNVINNQNDKIPSINWEDNDGEFSYRFFPTTTSNIGEIIIANQKMQEKAFIIIPGSRANLILYKLRRDPRLSRAFNPVTGNWRFLKFRHVKSLSENPSLSRNNLEQLLKLDPLTYTNPQLRMI